MPLSLGPIGGPATPGPAAGGALSVLYAGTMAESTLSGVHVLGATTLTLASAAEFRDDMTFGIGVEAHDIVSVDAGANQVEIAAPGLLANYVDGAACFCAPMWGADDTLALPAPAGATQYAELDCWMLYDLPQSNGNPSFYSGRSLGDYVAPHASWFHSLTNYSYWYAGGNVEEGLASYSVGVVHGTVSAVNFWALDYELATNRLIFLPADPSLAVSLIPRIYHLALAGRA